MITTSLPYLTACEIPAFAISTGESLSPIVNTGTPTCSPTTCSCFIAAGRYTSHATSSGLFSFLSLKNFASFAQCVVLPAPCKPTNIMIVGGFDANLIFSALPPIIAVSSSLTIFTIICDGTRDSITSAPTALCETAFMNSLTTLKFTSASSNASLICRIPSFISASESLPLFLNTEKALESFSASVSCI